jgi:hypothetical protein
VFSHNGDLSQGIDEKKHHQNTSTSFDDVNERYFKTLIEEYKDKKDFIYAICICVDGEISCVKKINKNGKEMANKEIYRRKNIGSMLLYKLIEEHGNDKDIYLDVLIENEPSKKLCKSHMFKENGDLYEDFAKDGKTLLCQTMLRKKGIPRITQSKSFYMCLNKNSKREI